MTYAIKYKHILSRTKIVEITEKRKYMKRYFIPNIKSVQNLVNNLQVIHLVGFHVSAI